MRKARQSEGQRLMGGSEMVGGRGKKERKNRPEELQIWPCSCRVRRLTVSSIVEVSRKSRFTRRLASL